MADHLKKAAKAQHLKKASALDSATEGEPIFDRSIFPSYVNDTSEPVLHLKASSSKSFIDRLDAVDLKLDELNQEIADLHKQLGV